MRVHILGICGTFMGGVAALARELGHTVEGSDANVYPPMSTQLEALGIGLMSGYAAEHLQPAPDLVVVGNAMTRGNPAVEYLLDARLRYVSGPQWLAERNVSCSLHQGGGFYVDLDCAKRVTIERARFLQDRVNECISSGCINNHL